MNNEKNTIEEFLNSNEFKDWQKSFRGITNYIRNGPDGEDFAEKVYLSHLKASIRLGSAYPNGKD